MRNNRTCVICGKEYSFCPSCATRNTEPAWKTLFHDENCMKIYEAVNAYATKTSSLAEAKKAIADLDLSYKDKIQGNFKKYLEEILAGGNANPENAKPEQKHEYVNANNKQKFNKNFNNK